MRFKFTADLEFEADSIDDAFNKLASHLLDTNTELDGMLGHIEVSPAKAETALHRGGLCDRCDTEIQDLITQSDGLKLCGWCVDKLEERIPYG